MQPLNVQPFRACKAVTCNEPPSALNAHVTSHEREVIKCILSCVNLLEHTRWQQVAIPHPTEIGMLHLVKWKLLNTYFHRSTF